MSNSVEEVRHHINTLNICSCNIGELNTIKYDQIRPMCSWKGPSMESGNLGDRYYFIYAKYVGFTTVNWLLYSNCWLWYIQYYLECVTVVVKVVYLQSGKVRWTVLDIMLSVSGEGGLCGYQGILFHNKMEPPLYGREKKIPADQGKPFGYVVSW